MAKQCWSQTVLESGSWGHSVLQTPALVKIYIEWYANMLKFFAEKMWVAFALQKLLTFFQQKILEYCILNPLKQLTKWPLTSSLS